jgi:hypothetical protein
MNRLTQKSQENLIVTSHEVEALVSENPIIIPVPWIINSMLPNVTRGVLETTVRGRE